ncbi:MAG: glycosyltransferase family 39 protein [Elusimicrobiota bacterium]
MTTRQPSAALERLCAAAVALGLFLRAAGLGAAIGPQEMMSMRPAARPLAVLLRLLFNQTEVTDPPLFHVLLRGWVSVFGFTPLNVRMFTVLIGAASIPAAAWAAHKLSGARAAWIAAAVVALHPFAVSYSLVARSYCLLVLLGLFGIGLLVEAERRDTPAAWASFFAVALAAALTHNHAPFMIIAAFAWLAYRARTGRWRPSARFALPASAAAALYAAWIPGLLSQLHNSGIPADDPSPLAAAYALSGVGVEVEQSATLWPAPWLALLLCAALAAALAARTRGRPRGVLLALLAGGAFSVLLPILVSYAVTPIFSPSRHAIIALPALCLFWAAALAEGDPPTAKTAALVLAVLFSYPLAGFLTKERTPYPAIAETVAAMRRPGTEVLVQPSARRDFIALYDPAEARVPAPLCGRAAERLPPSVVIARIRLRKTVPESERCDWRVLRERYLQAETHAFGWYAVVSRYELRQRGDEAKK